MKSAGTEEIWRVRGVLDGGAVASCVLTCQILVWGRGTAVARGAALFVLLGDGVDAFDELLALLARSSSRAARSASASWGWAGTGVGGNGSAAVNARLGEKNARVQIRAGDAPGGVGRWSSGGTS